MDMLELTNMGVTGIIPPYIFTWRCPCLFKRANTAELSLMRSPATQNLNEVESSSGSVLVDVETFQGRHCQSDRLSISSDHAACAETSSMRHRVVRSMRSLASIVV